MTVQFYQGRWVSASEFTPEPERWMSLTRNRLGRWRFEPQWRKAGDGPCS